MEIKFHKELALGKWFKLSLAQQMANIGSEVSRTRRWKEKDDKIFKNTADRALELFDLTLEDPRWKGRYLEIARAREVFCDALFDGENYGSSLESLEHYFLPFVFLSRK